MRTRRRGLRLRPLLDELDDRCLLSGVSQYQPSGYTPAQITGAYQLNAISFTSSSGMAVKGDGTGETIALIEMYHDPNIQSDLATFDAKYNLPNPTLTVVNQAGSQTDSGWALEESMDVEWAHAIAPGANILVVEAAPSYSQSQELQNLLNAVNTARNTTGVVAVSMSWGFNEMQNEASFDANVTTPTGHQGVSCSSRPAATTGSSNIRRPRPMCSRSAVPRLNLTSRPGLLIRDGVAEQWAAAIARSSRNRATRARCRPRERGARPMSLSMPTRIRGSWSIRRRRGPVRDRGRPSAVRAWAHRPGRG